MHLLVRGSFFHAGVWTFVRCIGSQENKYLIHGYLVKNNLWKIKIIIIFVIANTILCMQGGMNASF